MAKDDVETVKVRGEKNPTHDCFRCGFRHSNYYWAVLDNAPTFYCFKKEERDAIKQLLQTEGGTA